VKKKFWRCHVCNDIHFGIKAPKLCPTCRVAHAYVEIPSGEALRIESETTTKMNQEGFLKAITAFAENNEFQVNPDRERVDMLLDGVFSNEKNHGLKFCPCRLRTKDFEEDLKLVCPCNFRIHETYKDIADGECWCGLFIKRSEL